MRSWLRRQRGEAAYSSLSTVDTTPPRRGASSVPVPSASPPRTPAGSDFSYRSPSRSPAGSVGGEYPRQRGVGVTGCSGGPGCAYSSIAPSPAVVADPGATLVYDLHLEAMPLELQRVYARLHFDDEARRFLESCRPSCLLSTLARLLTCFLSVTDTNGLLGRGQMHVLSAEQCRRLLPLAAQTPGTGSLLDVGAGDGNVTSKLAPLFGTVVTTEVSGPMCRRLRQKGYTCFQTASIGPSVLPKSGCYDVVSILNVLDRCDKPRQLLSDAKRLMKAETGRLLLAVVLPFSEFVESGSRRLPPSEPLNMAGARCGDGVSFEESLMVLIHNVLTPLGFVVETVARVPYLCRGDMRHPFYVLYDAILVLSNKSAGATPPASSPMWMDRSPLTQYDAKGADAV